MPKSWPFSRNESLVILTIGIVTPLIDHRVDTLLFQFVSGIRSIVLFSDYLSFSTGGPLFGDLLQTWFQYGAILAAYLVRKPGAGTIAMTINGLVQVFISGAHSPHLLYGVTGLGADIVFASFRYRRYDIPAVSLAGVASAMFWYPIVFFSHYLYLYPPSFIVADLVIRVLGSAVGNGLLGATIGLVILRVVRRAQTKGFGAMESAKETIGFPFVGNAQLLSLNNLEFRIP